MTRKLGVILGLVSFFSCGSHVGTAQQNTSAIHVDVVLVQLNVAVTDNNGNYISGLRPEDFSIVEDSITETTSTFEEGNKPPVKLINGTVQANVPVTAPVSVPETVSDNTTVATTATQSPAESTSVMTGASVFILFDTSNYMYSKSGFVFAQDAVSNFIRSLEGVSKVALYSYSRNLDRVALLSPDQSRVLHGVRSTVAGDSAALYNSLLLTVKDAATITGKKAIVVFSNGPDDASLVPPEDVAELAQSTGTIIYMISTQLAEAEPISTAVFQRMSKATGGRAYFSKSWKDESLAFASIRDDLAHLYTLSYYPQPNANRGFRSITVKLVGKNLQKYRIRTRAGYRLLHQTQMSSTSSSSNGTESASR